MRSLPILLVAALLVLSCNNAAPVTEAGEEARDTAPPPPPVPDKGQEVVQSDSTIRFSFTTDVDSVIGRGRLEKNGPPVTCYLEAEKGMRITGQLFPDEAGANIRFSHIYLPDGSSDGPFGQSIRYPVRQSGTYRLVISPNRMAGDPANTAFTVIIHLNK